MLHCRADIYMHICDDLVRNVPVFQACRTPVIRVLVPNLVQEVYPPGEVIFNEVGWALARRVHLLPHRLPHTTPAEHLSNKCMHDVRVPCGSSPERKLQLWAFRATSRLQW